MRRKRLVALILLVLPGCGMHEFKSGDPLIALEQSRQATEKACWEAQKPDVYPEGMSEIAIVTIKQQESFKEIIGAVTGKPVGPCGGGTNLNDVLIADVKERNETARQLGGKAVGGLLTLGGAKIAADMVTNVAATKGNTTKNVQGDDNSVGRDKNDLANTGDGTVSYTGDAPKTTTTQTSTANTGSM